MTAIYLQAKGGDGYSQFPSVPVQMLDYPILDDCGGEEYVLSIWFPWLHDVN
jgi:hypothetical protein